MNITYHVTKHFQMQNLHVLLALLFTNKFMPHILVRDWGLKYMVMGV
jgi:hypothetical protein